jgi:hypothetical protein
MEKWRHGMGRISSIWSRTVCVPIPGWWSGSAALPGRWRKKIAEWKNNIDKDFQDAISKAGDETQEIDAKGLAAYRETTVDNQRQVIGAARLSFVCTALQDCLDEMASYLDKSHPRSPRSYRGKSWLQRRQQEYLEMFGMIRFESWNI